MFIPTLTLNRENQDIYTLSALTTVPNACFRQAGVLFTVPTGVSQADGIAPIQLLLEHREVDCDRTAERTVKHLASLDLKESVKTVMAYVVLENKILGYAAIQRTDAGISVTVTDKMPSDAALVVADQPSKLSLVEAGIIVKGATRFFKDFDTTVAEAVGSDSQRREAFRQDVCGGVRGKGFDIQLTQIPNQESDSLDIVRFAVHNKAVRQG